MSSRPLTTTSYAILCLLAIRPWATYELAQLMKRSLHFVWPRAESNLYAEPKRLVEGGNASATAEWNGDRKRTVYRSRRRGARRFVVGSGAPGGATARVRGGTCASSSATSARRTDLLAAIARVSADAEEMIEQFSVSATSTPEGTGVSPSAIHVNALLLTLMVEQARAAARWATWAARRSRDGTGPRHPTSTWAARTIRRVIDGRGG